MTGTSADGVDAALLETDGEDILRPGPGLCIEFKGEERRAAKDAIEQAIELGRIDTEDTVISASERTLTLANARAVNRLLADNGIAAGDVDLIGFHGQTVLHAPDRKLTWQIGDAALLATETGIDVVHDFRDADVAAGGQGAPLAPAYHAALARSRGMPLPVAFLNIGGIANVTWISEGQILAFDTGPGNGLIDDWVARTTGEAFDRDGALARQGRVNDATLATYMDNPWFTESPPKSLDRHDFTLTSVEGFSPADGAATLVALTVQSISATREHFPAPPAHIHVCGGGRHNSMIMNGLQTALGIFVKPVEDIGLRGDLIEAEAFAYLAVRSVRGLPLSWPSTTGGDGASTGGLLVKAGTFASAGTERKSTG